MVIDALLLLTVLLMGLKLVGVVTISWGAVFLPTILCVAYVLVIATIFLIAIIKMGGSK